MNIYDIAQEANVSIATVSRVINGKGYVSARTKKKVQEVLDKNNYTPSKIARGLATKSSNLVGVVLEDIRHSHYTYTAYEIEQNLHKISYQCVVCNSTVSSIQSYLKVLASMQVDGVIIIGSVFETNETKMAIDTYVHDIPVILLNGFVSCDNVTSILADDRDGIMQCMNHLMEKGHKKIIFVNDNHTKSAEMKLEGYRFAMLLNDLQDNIHVINTANSFNGGIEAGEAIYQQYICTNACTAIVVTEDMTALGCINALEKHGVRIPEDVAITGYDNSFFGKLSQHVLTTVDTNTILLGSEAVRAFSDSRNGISRPTKTLLLPQLFIGTTT